MEQLRFFTVMCLVLATGTAGAEAQVSSDNLPEVAAAEGRLDAILARHADHGEVGRYLRGFGGIAFGGGAVGVGTWLMVDDSSWDNRDLALLTGGIMIGMGTVGIASAIYTLARPSFGRVRYEQFRLAMADGLSEREVGQFEGALRLDAERGQYQRHMDVVTGFANILGGAGIIVATAAATTNSDQETFGFVVGGVMAGMGLLHALRSIFWTSRPERVWDEYRAGEIPEARSAVDVEVVPMASPENAGLTVLGTF